MVRRRAEGEGEIGGGAAAEIAAEIAVEIEEDLLEIFRDEMIAAVNTIEETKITDRIIKETTITKVIKINLITRQR